MLAVAPDPEWTALEAGLKPAVRITVATRHAPHLAAGLASRGAAVVQAPRRVRFARGEPETVLYVARARAVAESLREAEARTLAPADPPADRRAAHARMGALLGYPPCCVEAYVARLALLDGPGATTHEDHHRARAALAATAAAPRARLNDLLLASRIRVVTFYPCRYDCPAAGAYADALLAAIARKDEGAAAALDRALACAVAVAPDGARVLLDGVAARPPPRPNGAVDRRGDDALARRLAAATALPGDLVVVDFGGAR